MNTPTKTGPNVAGAAALPDVSELLADVADDAERLAVAGQLLADVAQHISTARAMLREVADTDPVHGVADLLAVAGWLADFGASMAGEPGHAGNPKDWFMRPTTRAAVDALGMRGAGMTAATFHDPDHPERLLVLVGAVPGLPGWVLVRPVGDERPEAAFRVLLADLTPATPPP
jgi:hypothetical protein